MLYMKRSDIWAEISTFDRLRWNLVFTWKKSQTNRSIVMERKDSFAARIQKMRNRKRYRPQDRPTFVHSSHTVHRSWTSETSLKVPFGKGDRLVVVHAGGDAGSTDGAALV